jgi:tetratricopeptide (TPR) repeat protein
MSRTLALVALCSAFLGACAQTHESPLASLATARATAAAGSDRTLCLADPNGATAVDAKLRGAQQAATKLPGAADRWVAAGREWVRKARLGSDPGFYVNVDGCASQALAVEPLSIAALELRGLVLMNSHQFEQARASSEQILAAEPENVTALGTLSDALLELGRYDEAAVAAQRQMNVRPGMASSARGSYLRWLHGDTRRAKLLIRDALVGRDAADPEPAAWVLAEAANIYWHEADYDGADALYAEALRWVTDFPAALTGRGRVALAAGNADRAVEYLRRAQQARPSVENAQLLGDALLLAGDTAGATGAFEQAEKLGRRGDKLGLALFLLGQNRDLAQAQQLIEEERSTRGGVYLDDAYAWALFRNGRLESARAMSAQALRLGTRDARLLYHAGAIALAAGERDEGKKLLDQALRLNPRFDPVAAAQARDLLANAVGQMAAK